MEEEEITRESFLGKIKELKSSKDNLVNNMEKGKDKVGNEAVIKVIMDSIKK